MSQFEDAVKFVLDNEGGFVDSPFDAGGATNFGISLRFLRTIVPDNLRKYGFFKNAEDLGIDDIKHLTVEQAKLIYKGEFWEGHHFEEIISQPLCNYIFDMAVNHGFNQAIKIVQRGTWAFTGIKNYLPDDGIMGLSTLSVINSLGYELYPVIVAIRAEFYRQLVILHPKDEANLEGWLKRCYTMST